MMLKTVVARAASKRLEREMRKRLVAFIQGWGPEAFRQAAEGAYLPREIIPQRYQKGLAARALHRVLKTFDDDTLLSIFANTSPGCREVLQEYPVWGEAFVKELRRMYNTDA